MLAESAVNDRARRCMDGGYFAREQIAAPCPFGLGLTRTRAIWTSVTDLNASGTGSIRQH